MKKKLSVGKKIGLTCFVISEIISCVIVAGMIMNRVENIYIPALLTFQGSIFVTTFTGVATKNFIKKDVE